MAWGLGMAVLRSRQMKTSPIDAVCEAYAGSRVAFKGKVMDVSRETHAGFATGLVTIDGSTSSSEYRDQVMTIEVQNENLVARVGGAVVGCVPDLITLVEDSSGLAIGTEEVRYGMHIAVLLLPAHPLLRTDTALAVVGPKGFNCPESLAYQPVADYAPPQSVFELAAKQ